MKSKLLRRSRQLITGAFNYSNPLGPSNLPLGKYWPQAGGLPLYIDPGYPRQYMVPYPPPPDQVHGTVVRMSDFTNVGPPFHYGQEMMKIKTSSEDSRISGNGTYHTPVLVPDSHGDYQPGSRQHFYVGGFVLANFSYLGGSLASDFKTSGDFTPAEQTAYFSDLSSWGPGAYRSLRPKVEKAGGGIFVAEFRDIPHMLKTSARGIENIFGDVRKVSNDYHKIWQSSGGDKFKPFMHPKKVADHFINHQFGWVPFLNDLRQIDDVYQNSKKYIAQLKRDNNQWVRRVRTMDHQESDQLLGTTHDWIVYPGDENMNRVTELDNGGSRCTNEFRTREFSRIWGVGIFKMYRPEFDDTLASNESLYTKVRQQISLYGLNVSPSLVYRATPWTWLVDWFLNVGNTIDNVSAMGADSVVARSLYLMKTSLREVLLKITLNTVPTPVTMSWSRTIETKQREVGSPYGFGLTPGQLSPKQLAILAALKITHS